MKTFDSFTVSFYTRFNKNSKKDCSIYCCVKVGTQITELCVFKSIQKNAWDTGKARPKQDNDYRVKLSIYLDSIKAKLFDIYMDIKLSGKECTTKKIKDIYLGRDNHQLTFLQVIDKAIDKYKHELAKGSIKNYYATRSYVSGYCKSKYKQGDILLKSLNYDFIDGLQTYILSSSIKPNDPCTNNGCMKHLERIKKIIRWAYEMRFIDRNLFASFKIRKKASIAIRLTWEQLKKIEQRELHCPMLEVVRDLFIFSCYTGMAPGDLQYLKPHQIYQDAEGTKWLTYIRGKSQMVSNVPLLDQALFLIKKYERRKGDLFRETIFPFVTNKDLNLHLKVISELCELGVSLNFYVARHTFASTVTLSHGVSITSIQAMMGHSKIESTVQYARVDKSVIRKEMMCLQRRLYG